MITICLLAAGKGERAALTDNKIKYDYEGKPIFKHAYDTFKDLGFNIITVARKEDLEFIRKHVNTKVIEGGETRLLSVSNALKQVKTKYVIIHDAARPFIKGEIIKKVVESLNEYDAAMVCKKATSTFYNSDLEIVDRNLLIEAETPQAFLTAKLKIAFSNRKHDNYTDDISVYKDYYKNEEVGLVFHETNNEKITTATSIKRYIMPNFKIGHAYDIHQLVKNRKLILGGVPINYNLGLLGHSDADVLIHAIAESILGALGIGDLGTHFPDTDTKYKDYDSKLILKYVKQKCYENDYEIVNIDASIYAEEPRLAPYLSEMKKNISEVLEISVEQINIKAGTNEKLDAIGNKKAIASEAVCLLKGYKK